MDHFGGFMGCHDLTVLLMINSKLKRDFIHGFHTFGLKDRQPGNEKVL